MKSTRSFFYANVAVGSLFGTGASHKFSFRGRIIIFASLTGNKYEERDARNVFLIENIVLIIFDHVMELTD